MARYSLGAFLQPPLPGQLLRRHRNADWNSSMSWFNDYQLWFRKEVIMTGAMIKGLYSWWSNKAGLSVPGAADILPMIGGNTDDLRWWRHWHANGGELKQASETPCQSAATFKAGASHRSDMIHNCWWVMPRGQGLMLLIITASVLMKVGMEADSVANGNET